MHFLCPLDAIAPDSAKGFLIAGTQILVVHKDNQFFAYLNHCPHRGIPLEWQPDQFLDMERQFIQCATHGALFSIEQGICIAGPCPGERLTPITLTIRSQGLYAELPA